MKWLCTVAALLVTAGGLAGCVSQQAKEAVTRVQAAARLLKEDDAKIEAGLKKLNEATKRAPKHN
jgi:hypothetical protein